MLVISRKPPETPGLAWGGKHPETKQAHRIKQFSKNPSDTILRS